MVDVHDYGGAVSFIPGAPETATVTVTVRVDSLRFLDEDVKAKDRRNIETSIRKELGAATSGNIIFQSTGVTMEMVGDGDFDIQIEGELRLHGVSRSVTVPAQLIFSPDSLGVTGNPRCGRQTTRSLRPRSRKGPSRWQTR